MYMFIVGGAALILQDFNERSTLDIDVIEVSKGLESRLPDYSINSRVRAHSCNFHEGYMERVRKLDVGGRKIDYYAMSLEDIVISKIPSNRDTDIVDIREKSVIDNLDWGLLDKLAAEMKEFALNANSYNIFKSLYDSYVKECGP